MTKSLKVPFCSQEQQKDNDKMKVVVVKKYYIRYSSCTYCKKTTHLEKYHWWRLMEWVEIARNWVISQRCANLRTNTHKLNKYRQLNQMFRRSNSLLPHASKEWKINKISLIDNGFINYMTFNASMIKNLDNSFKSIVRIGNGGKRQTYS
ncbi:hypothetical protein ACH5RR_012878 [Cinchona calisaya]|uniref:Uncharacterized protein n=1 Tax=Cinchona calisaya TaxID=153742 RepID=A0ABD3A941_9GENT